MYRTKKLLFFIIAAIVFTGCEIDSPIKEFTAAKSAITLAHTWKADVYAKDLLAEAEQALYDAHSLVKDGKNTDAAAKAVVSKSKADEAYATAIPLYVQATIDQANADIAAARDSSADEFAPDEMNLADGLVSEAEALHSSESYFPANQNAIDASAAAKSALEKTFAQIPIIQGNIAEIESERDELVAQDANQYASDDLNSLNEMITEAKENLAQKKIKESLDSVTEARDLVEKIKLAGVVAALEQKIAKANEGIDAVSKSPDASHVSAEIDSAKAKVKDAKDQLSDEKYDESAASADEALAIIDAINLSLERFAVDAKAAEDAKKVDQPKDSTEKISTEKIQKYIVQWRKVNTDCLWRIADKVYKNARLWPLIFMANRTQIKDPDLIYPGQKLVIPPVPKKPEKKSASATEKDGLKPEDHKTDVVKPDAIETPGADTPIDETIKPESSN